MVLRETEIDEETDRILTELAKDYQGDLSRALAELVQAHERVEAFAEEGEAANEPVLRTRRDRAEADFSAGRMVDWEELKSSNGL